MDRPMAPTAYVAEDGLVGHQREEKPLVLPILEPPPSPSVGECQSGEVRSGGWLGRGKGITFEM